MWVGLVSDLAPRNHSRRIAHTLVGGGGCATEERSECVLGTDGPQQRYPCVGFLREVKHFEVDAEHMVAVAVDSLTTSTNEKHQFIVEIAK
eukprot:COSAG01_NODE_7772_length_3063_cov_1551.900135_2_plen_91_part_00